MPLANIERAHEANEGEIRNDEHGARVIAGSAAPFDHVFMAAPADFKDVVLVDRKGEEFALRFVGRLFVKMQLLVYCVVNQPPGTRMRIHPIEKDCFCLVYHYARKSAILSSRLAASASPSARALAPVSTSPCI